jgi:parvulin-like peptidyl-prolyl isomerase
MPLLKAPLFHFILLGGAAYAVFAWTRDPADAAPLDTIVVTAGEVAQLTAVFEKTWQRPPSPEELDNLIERRVREEVFSREALAAGLDKDDAIVRRRLQQKLEFMLEDIAGQVSPTEQELQAYLDEHADKFRSDPRFTFRHVYLSVDKREDAEDDARKLLATLKKDTDTSKLGDRLMMIAPAFRDAPRRDVARALGRDFAAKLEELPTDAWSGPVLSGYGLHLVFLAARTEGAVPKLDTVRDAVAREWGVARRKQLNDDLYAKLRAKYTITVEKK